MEKNETASRLRGRIVAELRTREAMAARALESAIPTAAQSGKIRNRVFSMSCEGQLLDIWKSSKSRNWFGAT
jgi:hypothetical protein